MAGGTPGAWWDGGEEREEEKEKPSPLLSWDCPDQLETPPHHTLSQKDSSASLASAEFIHCFLYATAKVN